MNASGSKDFWDKLSSLSILIASILVPIVVALVGNMYTNAIKESENRVKYTDLAIQILKISPSKENEHIRAWSIDVINKYSGVPMSDNARAEFLNSNVLKQIDDFYEKKWIPVYVKDFMSSVGKDPGWQKAIASGNRQEIEDFVVELLIIASNEVLSARSRHLERFNKTSPVR